jgi:plasmid stabilization system protein ParE
VKLRYTKRAAKELAEVLDYIALRSAQGERSVSARIRDMIALLLQFLTAGQRTTTGRLRRLVVTPYPYLIFYRITEDAIVSHGVRHTARKPSSPPS